MSSIGLSVQDYAVLLVLFILFAFFAVARVVLLPPDREILASERLRRYASRLDRLQEDRARFDGVIAFGRLLTPIAFGVYAYKLSIAWLAASSPLWAVVLPVIAAALVLGLAGFYVPRAIARRHAEALVPLTYATYTVASWFLIPFVGPMIALHDMLLRWMGYDEKLAFLSSDDQSRMKEGAAGGEEPVTGEREMIRGIIELGETTVGEIMVPRIDIRGLEVGTDLPTVLTTIREEAHSRIPVYRTTIDTVVGILYVKDVLGWLAENTPESWDLQALLKTPHFVPTGKKINDLMAHFKRKHIHLAIVVDEYGGTAGLVTMEDILEEIVGDIQDEYDEEERLLVKVAENVYHVDPHMDLGDLGNEIGVEFHLEDAEYNTLSGLIYHEHGDVPKSGTVVEFRGLRIRVLQMEGQRIQKVELTVPKGDETPGDAAF